MASPFDFIAQSIAAHNGSATQTSSAPTSPSSPRTSPLEDYYNEQMQQKQATEKARDIIDGRGRGLVGGLRDAWLDKHPNVTTISTALSDDEKFQLQRAYADAANKYKDASKKAQSVSDKKAQSIRPEAGVNYATTLEKYRSELQAASDEKAAAESEMDKLRKQLEFYNVELPDVDQNIFERLWGSIKGGSKQAAGSLGGLFGYTGRVATGGQSAVDKALRASGNEELSALYHVGTEEEDEKAMQMQQAIADKSAELSESGGRDIERSKLGASKAGKFALDAVSQVPALAADMAANAVLPGSGMAMMMGRSFGGGAQQAEAGGGNLAQAGAYGAASAAKEYLTEKMFGGLDLAYGKGFADTAVEKLVGKLAKTDIGRTVLRTIINGGGGEFVEEFVSSAVDPTLRAIYNGKSVGENYSEEQVSDWLYDGLVGAALGIAGSGVSIATGADAKKNAELRSGEVDKAFELMTGKKAASEPQSVAETAGDITTPPAPSNDALTRPEELNSNSNAEVNAREEKNAAGSSEKLQNRSENGTVELTKDEALTVARSMFNESYAPNEIYDATGLMTFPDGSVLDPETDSYLYRPGSSENSSDANGQPTSEVKSNESNGDGSDYEDYINGLLHIEPPTNNNAATQQEGIDYGRDFEETSGKPTEVSGRGILSGGEQGSVEGRKAAGENSSQQSQSNAPRGASDARNGGKASEYIKRGEIRYPEFEQINIEPLSVNDITGGQDIESEFNEKALHPIANELLTEDLKTLSDEVKKACGNSSLEVVFLRDTQLPGGAVGQCFYNSGKILVCAESEVSPRETALHEALHILNRTDEDICAAVQNTLEDIFQLDMQEIAEEYAEKWDYAYGTDFSNPYIKQAYLEEYFAELYCNSSFVDEPFEKFVVKGVVDAFRMWDDARQEGSFYDWFFNAKHADGRTEYDRLHDQFMNEFYSNQNNTGSSQSSNTQDANSNYNADNANHSTGSNTAERVYVDENGNEYDPKTGYTTRTAEEVQAERDAHISDDLYYTLRAEDRLTPDNAKEWAQWQQRREERQNAQKAPVTDDTAWKDAEAEFGGANHDAIHKATQRAEEFETFLESDAFTSRLTDEQYTKVSDSVTEFKNKLAGLGDGHTSFAEFAEYYKAMKDSRILGDLYSERVNEQVQLARELAEEAYSNPIPYNVEKYRHAAVKAAQMTSHYIEKASKVRVELDELNNAVKENGSKRKPAELGREVERGEKGKSLREKAAAKFIRWQIMPRQMFQMIDGFKFWEKGAGYRMADTIENTAAKNQTTLVEADNFFTDVVKMKGYGDFATGKTKTSVRLGGKTLTMSEAVSLYKAIKTMGGPDAYRVQNIEGFALKNGDNKPYMIKADPANISGLYSALQTAIAKNEVASAYVKAFDNMSERLGKETQDVAKAIDGVDNELFKPGDYFPLTYARAEDVNSEWDKANSKDFGVPDFKNLKERTRTAGGYVNIAPVVEVTDGYIRRAADYIAFGELADTFGIMDYMHTFGTPTLVDSVKQNMGSEYGAWMENYVKDVQDINQTRAKSRDNWWQKLNHNFQTAVLIGNPGTPFKQKGSMWLAMSELDPRAVAKAAITSLNPGNQQIKAARNNPLLQFRAKGNIDSSITDALQDQSTLFSKIAAKSKVLKSIQNWIPAADVREISKVYLASCYDVQMKNPGIDVNSTKFKEMVDETFQRASMRTQSQYTMNMRDEISRGDSALLKALTMFQTQQRTTANSMFTAINEARAAKGTEHAAKANKALKNAATGFFVSNVAYATMDVLAKGLRHKLKQFRDEDDEEQKLDPVKIAAEVGKSFAEGVGGTVIFGDDVTNFILSVATGETFYENGIGAIGAIEDAASAFWNLTQNPSADNIRKTAGGFANLAGIPLNNAYTLLNSMGMYTLDVISAMNRSKESGNILNELLKGTSAADIAGKKKAGLYSISDDPADDALKIFDSIKKAVDKLPPDQFTYTDENGDEVSYELTKADKEQYRKDTEASYNSGMDALLKAFGYDKLGDKAKEDVEKQIKGYAKDAAEQGYLDNKGLGYDTGAPAWAEAVPKEDVPSYLVSKKILDADGKKTDYDAIDYLIGGFSKIPSSVQTQLKDDVVNVNALLYAKLFGIGSEAWYSNKGATKDAEESLGASDVAKAIAVYNNMEGKSDEQILNAIKTQVLPAAGGKQSATVRRIEAYNTIAGNNADLGSWLDLAAALKDADVNDSVSKDDVYTAWANMGLSARETYAGITRSDFYNIVKSGAKSYAVNEDYATQVDKGYASIVPAKEEADPTFSGSVRNHQADDSTAKSTSTFTMEDYYRTLGLLK